MNDLEERRRKRVREDEEDCGIFPSRKSVMPILSITLKDIIISTSLIELIISYHEDYPRQKKYGYFMMQNKLFWNSESYPHHCYNCSWTIHASGIVCVAKCTPIDIDGLKYIKYKILCRRCSDDNTNELFGKLGFSSIYTKSLPLIDFWISPGGCCLTYANFIDDLPDRVKK